VHRYITALTQTFTRVAENATAWTDAVADHANSQHGLAVVSL
jgi:hypothetical protein